MRLILVTGAAGPLGRRVARALTRRADARVHVVEDPVAAGRPPVEPSDEGSRSAAARAVLEIRPDVVLHLATEDPAALPEERRSGMVPVAAARALVAAIRRAGTVTRLVLRSDGAVYGSGPRSPSVLPETWRRTLAVPARARDLAAIEDLAAELAEHGVDVTILRLGPVLGPGSDDPLARLLRLPAVPTLLGHDPRLQPLHVDDAVGALLHAVDGVPPGVFNVAVEGSLYLSRILRLTRRLPRPLPGPAFRRSLRGLTAAGIVVPPDLVAVLRHGRVMETRAMRDELGFRPRHDGPTTILANAASPTEDGT